MNQLFISSIKKGGKFKLYPESEMIYTLVDYLPEAGVMKCICDNFYYSETYTDEETGELVTHLAWPESAYIACFPITRLVYPYDNK